MNFVCNMYFHPAKISYPGPQKGWDSSRWWKMVLVDVVEDLNILWFGLLLIISTLSSREMKSSISGSETPLFEAVTYARAWLTLRENSNFSSSCGNYQHPSVLVLNPLEELEDTVLQRSHHKIQNAWPEHWSWGQSSLEQCSSSTCKRWFTSVYNLLSYLQTSWKTSLEKMGRVQLSIALATTRHLEF